MGTTNKIQQDAEKKLAALAAVQLVKDGDVVGLGTGSTAVFAITALGEKVAGGLKITAAASSLSTELLARSLGIEVLSLENLSFIDISIDGADEFTSSLHLIKGGGGALFREKIMALLSRNAIIITDSSKQVEHLGAFTIPVEVIPVACQYVSDQIIKLNGRGILRLKDGKKFITDNGNYIIDADFGLIHQPEPLAIALNQIDGLLAHGLFIGITSKIIMGSGEQILTFS